MQQQQNLVVCAQPWDCAYSVTVIVRESSGDDGPAAGFQGHYTNKSSGTREGEATFYRTSRFRVSRKLDLSLRDCFKDILTGFEQPSGPQSNPVAAQRAQRAARHAQFKPLLQSSPHLSQVLLHVATVAQITVLEPCLQATSQQQDSTQSHQQPDSNSAVEQSQHRLFEQTTAQYEQQQSLSQQQGYSQHQDDGHAHADDSEHQHPSQTQAPSQHCGQRQSPRQHQHTMPQQTSSQHQQPSEQHKPIQPQQTSSLRADDSLPEGSICVVNSHFFFHPHASHVRNIHTAAITAEVKAFLDDGAEEAQQSSSKASTARPTVLFCGDLNSGLNHGTSGTINSNLQQNKLKLC